MNSAEKKKLKFRFVESDDEEEEAVQGEPHDQGESMASGSAIDTSCQDTGLQRSQTGISDHL